MLVHNSEMPFGPHKGERMGDVVDQDPGYLLRLQKVYLDDPEKPVYGRMRFVLGFIKKNEEEIKKKFYAKRRQYYKDNPEAVQEELERKSYEWQKRNQNLGKRI